MQVAGLQALRPRHPLGNLERTVTGQQHRLVDGDRRAVGRARDAHRPEPPDVAGHLRGEPMGGGVPEAGRFSDHAHVLTHRVGAHVVDESRTGKLDRSGQLSVELGSRIALGYIQGVVHADIFPDGGVRRHTGSLATPPH